MRREIRAEYDQMHLLPPALEDWVGEDHPARFIREFVEGLDLVGMGFGERRGEEGRPNYSAGLLLKVWLYGYMWGIWSTRKLERGCREMMGLIWLTGMQVPDHNTLWRFWRENREALRKVFRAGVLVAARGGMTGVACHGVDGTKIEARAGKRGVWERGDLERALGEIEASLDEMEREVEEVEEREEGDYRLPERLREGEGVRGMIREALKEIEEAGREHIHPGEIEARMMKCDGKIELAYNAQVVVDEKSGLIVAEEVVNEENDSHLLVAMLKQVEGNLGRTAEETLADGGYKSGEELTRAQQEGYSVLVNLGEEGKGRDDEGRFHTSQFVYDEQSDCCICPEGGKLDFERSKPSRNGRHQLGVYRCRGFRQCRFRLQCSRDRQGRTIEIGPYHAAVEQQRQKQKIPEKRELLKRRQAIVERVFAWAKHGLGFRRFSVAGLENVRTQWSLICTALNLRRLHQWWLSREPLPA